MEELAKKRSYSGSKEDEKYSKAYYETKNKYQEAKTQLNKKLDEEAAERRKNQKAESSTFVNSYGEATKRNITNQTYERQQRRQAKQIEKLVGG